MSTSTHPETASCYPPDLVWGKARQQAGGVPSAAACVHGHAPLANSTDARVPATALHGPDATRRPGCAAGPLGYGCHGVPRAEPTASLEQ